MSGARTEKGMMEKGSSMGCIRRPAAGGLIGAAMALGVAMSGGTASAQTAPPPEALASESLAVNLVELLVKQGVISRIAANELLRQAEQQTLQARAAHEAAPPTPGEPAGQQMAQLPPAAPGVVRVPYVPQIVRDQIRDEIKGEVMQQAKEEGWAKPGSLPGWLDRVTISGDLRVRSEYDLFSANNTDELIDFATFNANGPTDINPNTNPNGLPFLNTRRSRYNNLSIRARLAIDGKLSDSVGAGIRLATGNTNGPSSTTQLLGNGFGKDSIWLDRAFVWFRPARWATLTAGRMPNPFFTTDLLYSDDLNFDGADARFTYNLPKQDLRLSLVGGAFPFGYQSPNFPTQSSIKQGQRQRWLYAVQATADWDTIPFDLKFASAYYDFSNVRGLLSEPCPLYNGAKQCSTDFSAVPFMNKGNTLFFIRDILPNPASPLNYAQPQLLGLSFPYRLFDVTTTFDYRAGYSHHLIFTGEYVRNLAFHRGDICRYAPNGLPVNNLETSKLGNTDPCGAPPTGDTKAIFQSGPTAWMVKLLYGDPDPTRFGEWNISAGYRYIEPDALLDGYNSPDFHLGGTNAKGYTVTATMGLFSGAYLQARWFSADEVYGPPLSIDVGQLDLHVRF
jgi:hypothetical protein